jgi:hypothetical protein
MTSPSATESAGLVQRHTKRDVLLMFQPLFPSLLRFLGSNGQLFRKWIKDGLPTIRP